MSDWSGFARIVGFADPRIACGSRWCAMQASANGSPPNYPVSSHKQGNSDKLGGL
jgi:hypothetical protein